MFSGIVEGRAKVAQCNVTSDGARLVIATDLQIDEVNIGDSISIDGVCLTVVAKSAQLLSFDVVNETLRRTTLGKKIVDTTVNIERSLRVGDRIHGHIVSGHVDAVVTVREVKNDGESIRLTFSLPETLRRYVVQKGSICISGVSLTVGEVSDEAFSVYIVPHTAAVTTLGLLEPGGEVNIEIDMLARYVASMMQRDV